MRDEAKVYDLGEEKPKKWYDHLNELREALEGIIVLTEEDRVTRLRETIALIEQAQKYHELGKKIRDISHIVAGTHLEYMWMKYRRISDLLKSKAKTFQEYYDNYLKRVLEVCDAYLDGRLVENKVILTKFLEDLDVVSSDPRLEIAINNRLKEMNK